MSAPAADDLATRIRRRVEREGPITFAAFMEAALYDPDDGFFATGRGAGRRGGDFVTSVEVGSLFGALVAVALERWWDRLGRPDPFVVVEAGAGRGQLARDVLRTQPAFAPALRWVLVERSAALLAEHHRHLPWEPPEDALGAALASGDDDEPAGSAPAQGPIVTSLAELPAIAVTGVVVANELLDNLPFRLVERTDRGWAEVRLGLDGEVQVPADPDLATRADALAADAGPVPLAPGTRLPVPIGVGEWLRDARRVVRRGGLLLVDYVVPVAELVNRGTGWLRTYRGHARGGAPWDDPGSQDITIDVPEEAVVRMAAAAGWALDGPPRTQAAWLEELGLPARVAAAREHWGSRAHVGDLDALRARSVVAEAAALTDGSGLGAHWVAAFHSQ